MTKARARKMMNEARMGCGVGTRGWRQDGRKESGDNVTNNVAVLIRSR